MYRIEVAPGEETVFRTIEELAVGIRNGVITPRARIYHHASQKWLPIGLHPHYKKALEMPAATTTPTPSRLKAHPPAHPEPHSIAHPPEPRRVPEPRPSAEPKFGPKAATAPRIPSPVQSPVIAMQNEVLRDLPVISIPEPLPWTVPAPKAAAFSVKTHAPAVPAPAVPAPAVPAPAAHAPAVRAPAVQARMTHAPVAYAPLEFSSPVAEPEDPDADGARIPRPTARRARQMSGRPFMLLGAAAALVIGTHLVVTAAPPASADPSDPPAAVGGNERSEDSSVLPSAEDDQLTAGTTSTESRATEAPRVMIAPARVPMTPGPAFAGSVPARPGADSARPKAPLATPAPTPASSIAPAPAAIDLALPNLAPDSAVSTVRTADTLAMKKILRALNGPKPAEVPAAQ